ncbi:MAG: hypothetical protein EPN21_02640 [Methylococcaceae bacterium]|nr:MAG: hypothetical protein EPN21_02640 [Methylococcaceae bacterium]
MKSAISILTAVLALTMPLAFVNAEAEEVASSPEQVVRKFYKLLSDGTLLSEEQFINAGVTDIVGANWDDEPTSLCLEDSGEKLLGVPCFIKTFATFHSLIPDMNWHPEEIVRLRGPGIRYLVRATGSGTPQLDKFDFLGLGDAWNPGASFSVMSIDIHTLKHGKIVKSYHVEDWLEARHQLSQ